MANDRILDMARDPARDPQRHASFEPRVHWSADDDPRRGTLLTCELFREQETAERAKRYYSRRRGFNCTLHFRRLYVDGMWLEAWILTRFRRTV